MLHFIKFTVERRNNSLWLTVAIKKKQRGVTYVLPPL